MGLKGAKLSGYLTVAVVRADFLTSSVLNLIQLDVLFMILFESLQIIVIIINF